MRTIDEYGRRNAIIVGSGVTIIGVLINQDVPLSVSLPVAAVGGVVTAVGYWIFAQGRNPNNQKNGQSRLQAQFELSKNLEEFLKNQHEIVQDASEPNRYWNSAGAYYDMDKQELAYARALHIDIQKA